jgi:hypothetical protein
MNTTNMMVLLRVGGFCRTSLRHAFWLFQPWRFCLVVAVSNFVVSGFAISCSNRYSFAHPVLGLGLFSLTNLIIPPMNSHNAVIFSEWSVLSFNVRGINSVVKGNGIHCAIRESRCDIICLQETKKDFFDMADLRKFCPNSFDAFAFVPSVGNSGGFITVWNSSKLVGSVIFQNDYALSVEFSTNSSNESWIVTNI